MHRYVVPLLAQPVNFPGVLLPDSLPAGYSCDENRETGTQEAGSDHAPCRQEYHQNDAEHDHQARHHVQIYAPLQPAPPMGETYAESLPMSLLLLAHCASSQVVYWSSASDRAT